MFIFGVTFSKHMCHLLIIRMLHNSLKTIFCALIAVFFFHKNESINSIFYKLLKYLIYLIVIYDEASELRALRRGIQS